MHMSNTFSQNNYAEPQIKSSNQQAPHNPVTTGYTKQETPYNLAAAGPTGQAPRGLLPERKKSWYRFTIALFVIFIIAMIGIAVFEKYFSPEAKQNEQERLMEQQTLQRVQELETALRNDTVGGKTPEETLALFLSALKNNDIELAGQYFVLNTNEQSPYYLTRQEWIDGLNQTQKEGKISDVISILSKATPDFENITGDNDFKFKAYEKGILKAYVNLQFNKYSNVWKIESM